MRNRTRGLALAIGLLGMCLVTEAGLRILVETRDLQPFAKMPEVFLAAALQATTSRPIHVVSVGAEGWGQDQQLLALQRLLPAVRPHVEFLSVV